jgi:hypothetical protein
MLARPPTTVPLDPWAARAAAPPARRDHEEGSGVSAQIPAAAPGASAKTPAEGNASPSSSRRRSLWLLALGAGLIGLLAVLGRPLTAGTREPVIVDVPAPAARVRLNLQAAPPSARFILDGQPLGTNPYQGEHTADSFAHTLEVRAEGHQRRSIEVRLNRDLDLEVRLAEEAPRTSETAGATPLLDQATRPRAIRSTPGPSQGSVASRRDQPSPALIRRTPEPAHPSETRDAPSGNGDDIYPDEPLPAPKPAPLEDY